MLSSRPASLALLLAFASVVASLPSGMHPIRGKRVVVTGASRGLGLEIASAFASEGAASVYLVARTAAALEATCFRLSAEHPEVEFVPIAADVTSAADRLRVVETAGDVHIVSVTPRFEPPQELGSP